MEALLIVAGIAGLIALSRWLRNATPDIESLSDEDLAQEVMWDMAHGDSESVYYDETARRAEVKRLMERAA